MITCEHTNNIARDYVKTFTLVVYHTHFYQSNTSIFFLLRNLYHPAIEIQEIVHIQANKLHHFRGNMKERERELKRNCFFINNMRM